MARIRSDKPESYQSETLAEVSLAAERTFRGMATVADDRGRLADKPAQINGDLWSMRSEREPHTSDDLEAELQEMLKVDLICRYTGCDGKRYIHLVRWDAHQKIDRPSKSRLPRCPVHQGEPDYCGLHAGACAHIEPSPDSPEPSRVSREGSRDSREPSRDLQPPQTGHRETGDHAEHSDQGELIAVGAPTPRANDRTPPEQAKSKSSRVSREASMQDLGSRTVDRGSVPATPDAGKPRRRPKTEDPERAKNAGDIVKAFVDGATSVGQPDPPASIRARVGRDARSLLGEGYEAEALIKSAYRMGAGEWNDLAVQVRKDSAGNGRASPGGRRQQQPPVNPRDEWKLNRS